MDFDYTLEPGKTLENKESLKQNHEPVISIITPFYSGHEYLEQTARSILNQTYPYFEWVIVNDGRTDKESLELLEKIQSLDHRIKVYSKKNEGLAATRDYGAKKSNKSAKYLFFLDDDDLIEKTYLECAYWTLETNKEASFAYADCIGFGAAKYLWAKWFNIKEEKKQNMLVATAMIRKKDFFEVGGYNLKQKAINEDWIFWMKLFSYGKFPVRMNYYAFWYRRKESGELKLSQKKENLKITKKIINDTLKKVKGKIEAIQYPRSEYDWNQVFEVSKDNMILPEYKDNKKTTILMIIPWITMGGADKFNLDLISGIDNKKYEVIVITTEPGVNKWRQKMEQVAKEVYDLTTFIDRKYWHLFIKYIIESRNVNIILNSNSMAGYEMLPYLKCEFPDIPIMDYIHMEEWYNRNGGYSRDSSAVASAIDRTLTCNRKSGEILVNYFKRNPKDIDTVYIGVDEKKFNLENYNIEELKNKYGIPKDKFIINFICRIDYQKRPFLFVEIMKELYSKNKDFICLVAGNGPLLDKVKALCTTYNLNNNVKFLGTIKETQEIYAISDLSLNCSIKEGLALTSYESLSMGIPVITSNVGGQSELIDSSVGSVVPCLQNEEDIKKFNYSKNEINSYVDSILEIMKNVDKYKGNARNKILNGFTINQMILNMEREFDKILKSPIKKINAENKDICLELINQYNLATTKLYSYMCEDFNVTIFYSKNYKNGCTTSKIKLSLISFVKKIGLENEAKIVKDIVKNIARLIKSIIKKIVKLFKKLFRIGSEKNENI